MKPRTRKMGNAPGGLPGAPPGGASNDAEKEDDKDKKPKRKKFESKAAFESAAAAGKEGLHRQRSSPKWCLQLSVVSVT